MNANQVFGLHMPNRALHDAGDLCWQEVAASRSKWVKLLWPDHRRSDAARARSMGLKIVVRAPGEGRVYTSDVYEMLDEFESAEDNAPALADYFEIGNEPDGAGAGCDLWTHAWYLDFTRTTLGPLLHRAGIQLLAPGWTGNAEPWPRPPAGTDWHNTSLPEDVRLAARLCEVYDAYDAIGWHAYGDVVLEQPQVDRVQRWHRLFPTKPLLGTEIGIAARDLVAVPPSPANYEASKLIKGRRYAAFAQLVCQQVPATRAVIGFIADGCTPEFESFRPGGKADPNGTLGYCIGLEGWQAAGQEIA